MLGRIIISLILFFCLLSVERRENAPLNGELLRQRLVGGAKMRAAQQSAGAERSLRMSRVRAILDRRSAQLAVSWRNL